MRVGLQDAESWKRMVLGSMPPPAWLSEDAPASDVAMSTRVRIMRNVAGFRFPHRASPEELKEITHRVLQAAKESGIGLEANRHISNAEHEYLVGCRLISPEFEWKAPGRAILLDKERSLSVMINEEDHIRIQALTAGWSPDNAEAAATRTLKNLETRLNFAFSPDWGYLAASPYNLGRGQRLSAMLHLIGLAHAKRLPTVLKALVSKGITARGLFGESSRAVGAFLQISIISSNKTEFVGACEYLIREERQARLLLTREALRDKAEQVQHYAVGSRKLDLSETLRMLAWIRWAAAAGIEGFPTSTRVVDSMLTALELRGSSESEAASVQRAAFLRKSLA